MSTEENGIGIEEEALGRGRAKSDLRSIMKDPSAAYARNYDDGFPTVKFITSHFQGSFTYN